MPKKQIFRYRLYRCDQYYVEVWDTLERQWEELNRLPDGLLLLILEDTKKESLVRFKKKL
ncbi:MAG: hypothetical protein A3J46_01015 [Candidatus Yanofskybacteria bacterium RIFCSPHIGHO2_02_FULL_41_11]|uniref:Uncharacterized protein n=1 Tax=Candidatus Yanofskybacteria bacterium RIFCSPHIGHO2_02_FULL_41_11 TaxID=1802675 RepID=A0A1F8F4Z7_9BACT|nr:MAG: hypothetical protein A3J46_01015 [Candidatus Yanofskybacteria bacterium RIFCSPHIGHO2_02_FULL_41_11]